MHAESYIATRHFGEVDLTGHFVSSTWDRDTGIWLAGTRKQINVDLLTHHWSKWDALIQSSTYAGWSISAADPAAYIVELYDELIARCQRNAYTVYPSGLAKIFYQRSESNNKLFRTLRGIYHHGLQLIMSKYNIGDGESFPITYHRK